MSDKFKLTRMGNILYINPWLPKLADVLTVFRKKTMPGKRGAALDVTYVPEILYYLSNHTTPKIGATYGGFYNRVANKLTEWGFEYETEDLQHNIPSVDLNKISEFSLREGQDTILAAVLTGQRGVIKAPTAMGKSFVIELLCLLYDKQHVLIITSSSSVLSDLHRRVSARCPNREVIKIAAGKPFLPEADIVICSARSLHHVDTEWPDLLLFDEVHGASAPQVSKVLAGFTKPRMFGFSASPTGRSDSADLMAEAFFGPIVCDIKYSEAQGNKVVSPIEVWMIHVKGAEIHKGTPTSRDRWNIWRNRERNDKIKEAVERFHDTEQILIKVNFVEHALYLRKLLPEFTVVYSTMTDVQRQKFSKLDLCEADEPLQLDLDKLKDDFRSGVVRRAIVTGWKEGVDFPNLRVVIRADGTKGPIPAIQIGGRLSRIADGKSKGIVIDFVDDFGNCFLNRSKDRLKNYKKEGWTVVDGYGDSNLG